MTTSDDRRMALVALRDRTVATLEAVGEAFPYIADQATGTWDTTPDGNWAGGYWVGLLDLAAAHAGPTVARDQLRAAADCAAETVRDAMPATTPFRGLTCQVAGFRGYDLTGDRARYGLGFDGADAMVSLFDETARQVPIGTVDSEFAVATRSDADEFPDPESEPLDRLAAVDTVHLALPVLWRAFRETCDPRFRDVAVAHADRHLDWFLRADGSTWNEVAFDPEVGALERQFNPLAHGPESCWARGLGWHVAGLARAYRETGAGRYRSALERSVDYYRTHTPSDLVPYWDLEAPGIPDEPRDTSAAALVAYGLARLPAPSDLRRLGRDVLDSLVESYLITDPSDDRRGMVTNGTFSMPAAYGIEAELIWTDYYVARTLHDLLGS